MPTNRRGKDSRTDSACRRGKLTQKKLSISSADANSDKYFLAMSNICTSNPLFKSRLFEYFDFDIKKTFECDKSDLALASEFWDGMSIPKEFLSERDKTDPDKFYENFVNLSNGEFTGETSAKGIKYIIYNDPKYPKMLKNIPDFPLMLYYKGGFEGINFDRTVAFVGSRKASAYAKETVLNIISEFKGLDIAIVSGLAEGIDAKSHQAALQNNIKTIGVIGSGFKFQYPSVNKHLYDEIENGGGIIFSEYPYEMPPMPYQFPLRNRIVTGISYGTVVAEARIKSGAMISAKLTLEQGRELMCIPGLISNPNTEGIYHLLKNGAAMVTGAEDILDALNWNIQTEKKDTPDLNEEEKRIYEEISIEAKNMEDLAAVLNISINDLMVNLTSMELKGLIKQSGGSYFISG